MGIQDVIAIGLAAGALFYAGRSMFRTMNSGSCSGCSQNKAKAEDDATLSQTKTNGLTRRPLVPVDQVGLPESPRHSS